MPPPQREPDDQRSWVNSTCTASPASPSEVSHCDHAVRRLPGGPVQRDDDSWLITSEVTLAPEAGEGDWAPVRVQVITVPADHAVKPNGEHSWDLTKPEFIELPTGERLALGRYYSKCFRVSQLDVDGELFVRISLHGLGFSEDFDWTESIFRGLVDVPIPILGSPPHDWQSMINVLSSSGSASIATAVVDVDGIGALGTWVIVFTTMTALINIYAPATEAVGNGVKHKINQFMGTPPGAPAED